MPHQLYILRYAEVGLKSHRVRNRFVRALMRHLGELLAADGVEAFVDHDCGRVYLRGPTEAESAMRRCFGVVSFSPAEEAEPELEAVSALAAKVSLSDLAPGRSFAIRPRRSGTHPFTSQDVGVAAGSAVVAAWTGSEGPRVRVDLSHPEVEIFCEVRQTRAFVFTERIAGPGGLPYGTQGTVAGPLASREDLLALYLLMKRGCRAVAVVPVGGSDGELVSILRRFDPTLRIVEIDTVPRDPASISSLVPWAKGVVLGWTYEDLEANIATAPTSPLTFYPLVGLDPAAIDDLDRTVRDLAA